MYLLTATITCHYTARIMWRFEFRFLMFVCGSNQGFGCRPREVAGIEIVSLVRPRAYRAQIRAHSVRVCSGKAGLRQQPAEMVESSKLPRGHVVSYIARVAIPD